MQYNSNACATSKGCSNTNQYLEAIKDYNLLYILVDNYIDNMELQEARKESVIQQLFMISEGECITTSSKLLSLISECYNRLITNYPQVKEPIAQLLNAEVEGLKIQKNGHLSREEYFHIACRKGKWTFLVLAALVEETDLQSITLMGEVLQLLDDCLDYPDDLQSGIHTIATHDRQLDRLWHEIADKIGKIDSKFNIFVMIYSFLLAYLPGSLPDNYSTELKLESGRRNILEGTRNGEIMGMLNGWILENL
jgi:hypothetical protein